MAFEKQRFILINPHIRQNAMRAVHTAPDGYSVTVAPATRSLDQNAKFHAICSDLAKSDLQWVRIPTKPASDSDQSPATHSDFIPAGIPI